MFTLADVRNIAVQIEENGEASYRRAAGRAREAEMARILTWMAEEERQHAELFTAIIDERPLSTEQRELEAMGRALLQDIVRSQTFSLDEEQLDQTVDLDQLLAQSLEFEKDTIDFYEFLAGFLDDPQAISQINAIIEQERGHVKQLTQMRTLTQSQATRDVEPEQTAHGFRAK